MIQRSIDFDAPPYVRGSETSKAAAESMVPHVAAQRARVLEVIQAAEDGVTDQEGAERCGLTSQSWCPRRLELERAGLIQKADFKRATRSGRQAVVWRVK